MIDINDFKHVNDQYGHKAGDSLLQKTANALKEACKEISGRPFICRYGGDEFMIALVGENESGMEGIEKCLKGTIEEEALTIADYKLSISVGAATEICAEQSDIDALLILADKRMYANKNEHKKSKMKKTVYLRRRRKYLLMQNQVHVHT